SLEMRRRLEHLIEEINVQVASPLIALLDEDEFAVRQKAHEDLEQLGERARPALERAFVKSPSAEVKARAEALLRRIEMLPKKPKERGFSIPAPSGKVRCLPCLPHRIFRGFHVAIGSRCHR